ncbi:MAG: DUF1836 domain-containing protein [Lachnospiraceae bacterium]|nr:DUF1836 domain-containing protein [Lachnospiraceae bacterium]
MEKDKFLQEIEERIEALDFIKPGMFPKIDLYMDQVTTFMDSHMKNSKRNEDDKILTKTMINNYAKNDLFPSPEKKKYTNDHMYILTLVYYLKSLLSINDTQILLKPMTDRYFGGKSKDLSMEEIYNSIYRMCRQQHKNSSETFEYAFDLSTEAFDSLELPKDEKEYLQVLSYICVLGFDAYLKKTVIEMLLDRLKAQEEIEEKRQQEAKKEAKKQKDTGAKKTPEG